MKTIILLKLIFIIMIFPGVVPGTGQKNCKKHSLMQEPQRRESTNDIHRFHLLRRQSTSQFRMFGMRGNEREMNRGFLPNYPDIPIMTQSSNKLTPQEIVNMQVVIEDFQVNESTGPCGAHQFCSAIAVDGNGNFVVCWQDERNNYYDIYAQRYSSSGTPLGANFKVNDDYGNVSQFNPDIAMDESGNFVICWEDRRNGYYDIYAQRYNSDGTAQGTNFEVNDDTGLLISQSSPAIAINGGRDFVICWGDDRNGDSDIYAQRYNSDGTALGANFKVSDDTGSANQWYSAIAIDGSGNFVICWMDPRDSQDGIDDIYAQRYHSDGTAQGVNFKVNDDPGDIWQEHPDIAMDGGGNFIICWADYRSEAAYDIYAQRYNSSGVTQGSNFKVNDNTGSAPQLSPAIAMDGSGDFVICWRDNRIPELDIYAQRYDSSGTAQGSNFKVNDDTGSAQQDIPDIAMNVSGNFVICWSDERNGFGNLNFDIYAQRYNGYGTAQGVNFKVNDDTGSADQQTPAIDVDKSGNFVICWLDYRNCSSDIYAQRYDNDDVIQGSNFKVNDDTGDMYKDSPDIGLDAKGDFVICWKDKRNQRDIYAQRYDNEGIVQGVNFKVNDDTGSAEQENPTIDVNESGNFVISWRDMRDGRFDNLYAQRYDSSGTAQGSNFKVNDDTICEWRGYPGVSIAGSGNFVICWGQFNNGDHDIYAQRYNSDGIAQGLNFKVNDDTGTAWQIFPAVTIDGSGNFVTCWEDYRDGHANIYAQRYDSSGAALGSNFKVNDDIGGAPQYSPAISADGNGSFMICWTDRRNGNYDIYGQRYNSNGQPIDGNYRINNDPGNAYQELPDVSFQNGRIYFTWQDDRVPEQGYDIFARVEEFISGGWDITGRIGYYSNDDPVDSVLVKVNSLYSDTTDLDGNYEFLDLSPYNYVVRPEKENDIDDAISSYDAAWILQEGVGLRTFNPYQMIAGDVTGNGDVSAYDAALVLQYGVELINKFPIMPDTTHFWRFVPENFALTPSNWATAPDSIAYTPLNSDTTDNYYGIIFGDVTGNWHPSGSALVSLGKSSARTVNIRLKDIYGEAGDKLILPMVLDNGSDILAISFTLGYDAKVLKALSASTTALTESWQIAHNIKQGEIKVALAGSKSITNSGAVVNLEFEVLRTESPEASSPLNISEITINEDNVSVNIQSAKFTKGTPLPKEYALSQNYPNPFNAQAVIKYQLPKAGRVVLKIYNTLGQEVRMLVNEEKKAGYYSVTWEGRNDEGVHVSSGIYIYRFETGDFVKVRKMLFVM